MAHVPTYAPGELSPDDLLSLELAAQSRQLTPEELNRLIETIRTAWDEVEKAEEKLNSAPDTEYEFGWDAGYKEGEGEGYSQGIESGKGILAREMKDVLSEARDGGLSLFEQLNRLASIIELWVGQDAE
jgi:flagellar biosynthesis/type III secretory pathway protein FliH